MAASSKSSSGKSRKIKRKSHMFLRKIGAGVCLLAVTVMLISGFLAGISLVTTAFRASIAVAGVLLVQAVLLTVLSMYEDIDRGKA